MGDGGEARPDLDPRAGEVTVARKNDPEKVVVGPGQGVDISGLGRGIVSWTMTRLVPVAPDQMLMPSGPHS